MLEYYGCLSPPPMDCIAAQASGPLASCARDPSVSHLQIARVESKVIFDEARNANVALNWMFRSRARRNAIDPDKGVG